MSYQLLRLEHRKARRVHRCTWCGQEILRGERYQFSAGVYDGAVQVDKFHPECEEACSAEAREYGGTFEYSPGENERPPRPTTHNQESVR